MRHHVLTRAVYDPELWSLEANRRRLALLRGITAASLWAQTERRFRWVVLLHPDDPLHAEREVACNLAGCEVSFRYWAPPADATGPRTAALAYKLPIWREETAPRSEATLTTRLDDDDAFAPWALHRIRRAGHLQIPARERRALIAPVGFRVWDGHYSLVRHERNAWSTLLSPVGDDSVVYDFNHVRVGDDVPVSLLDDTPAWLWVRHPDTLSKHRRAEAPIDATLRDAFPGIDWDLLTVRRETVDAGQPDG